MNSARWRIEVQGLVQGVGFRPFVWSLASQFNCTGFVRNDATGVLIEIQGEPSSLARLVEALRCQAPLLARIDSINSQSIESIESETNFQILDSRSDRSPLTLVAPDTAPCDACLRELLDVSDRRYGYPFINCTHCGPRFTIQTAMPYDRQHTTMREFMLCELCRAEYESPADRRFHAQPNACPKCGPSIWFSDFKGPPQDPNCPQAEAMVAGGPSLSVAAVRAAVAAGRVIAIKGIGGFHLACDARNRSAVRQLRARKQRPFKPLAVMVADLDTAHLLVHVTEQDRRLLNSPQRPIVLLRKRQACDLPEEVAPSNPYLGIVLPYSPLHYLLVKSGDVWIMTSGNLADEPIAYDNQDAIDRLSPLADGFLLHNRTIHTVCDDSVWRSSCDQPISIRRSRGYAPLPVPLPGSGPTVLAVGGEIKAALCLARGSHAFVGQHIGDMGNRETLLALKRSCDQLLSLYQAKPELVVADQHPGYLSVAWARQRASDWNVPLIQVQHHHAHAAAVLAEHQVPVDQSIITCVFDGTGYGSDGAIWGGEILLANARTFQRAGHLQYAALPGGDSCILKPAKTALAFLFSFDLPWTDQLPCVQSFTNQELTNLRIQLQKKIGTVPTSSMGRLFDAVAALIGLRQEIDYEGQAALELEALADDALASEPEMAASIADYSMRWSDEAVAKLDAGPLLQQVVSDVLAGTQPGLIAARFHQSIAAAVTWQCQRLRQLHAISRVGLTGGVFQNALLLKLMRHELDRAGFEVLTHRVVPPNDGGLSLGQVVVARAAAL